MNQHLGWESIFFLNAVVGLAVLAFAVKIEGNGSAPKVKALIQRGLPFIWLDW